MRTKIKVATKRGVLPDGVLFHQEATDTVLIAITGIHTGALLIGTLDTFTYGNPSGFLKTINDHMPTAAQNKLLFIEGTGHTYQQKHQEVAEKITALVKEWRECLSSSQE